MVAMGSSIVLEPNKDLTVTRRPERQWFRPQWSDQGLPGTKGEERRNFPSRDLRRNGGWPRRRVQYAPAPSSISVEGDCDRRESRGRRRGSNGPLTAKTGVRVP